MFHSAELHHRYDNLWMLGAVVQENVVSKDFSLAKI
jgi:hypothetical protein